jgi:carboxyl-terminal processing protease
MAVLIYSNTASGGELVAAALGDNKRAILLGEKTYGKGTLQTIIPIPSRGALKLTTAYFVSPNGNAINQAGVTPDVEKTKSPGQGSIKNNKRPPIILKAIDLLHGIVTPDSAAKQ